MFPAKNQTRQLQQFIKSQPKSKSLQRLAKQGDSEFYQQQHRKPPATSSTYEERKEKIPESPLQDTFSPLDSLEKPAIGGNKGWKTEPQRSGSSKHAGSFEFFMVAAAADCPGKVGHLKVSPPRSGPCWPHPWGEIKLLRSLSAAQMGGGRYFRFS